MDSDNFVAVQSVLPGSIAQEAGIEPGDRIISINNEKFTDIFDYRFLIADSSLLLEIQKKDGETWEIEIEKDEYEDLGIEFENSMIDEARSCKNKCIFCFIDQLPPGMRETLYFKDDDSRLSFLMGNYVTMTNMSEADIERIVRYKMSPINVSVHTTNPELRVSMLKNKYAGNIMDKIKTLVDGGISVNCQIVLCRDINDGQELDRTISDLSGLYPGVNSISVVPVGITRYRESLYSLTPFDNEASTGVIKQIEAWQSKLMGGKGSRIVYPADEFYIMAGIEIPSNEYYEDFPQIENGVGLIALLRQEFYDCLKGMDDLKVKNRKVSIATGVSAYTYIKEMSEALEKRFGHLKINVFEIKNNFFGENVTVAGLLTGTDLASQLAENDLGDGLLISKSMLRDGTRLFLDDYTVDMLMEELDININTVENDGKDFVEKLLGMDI